MGRRAHRGLSVVELGSGVLIAGQSIVRRRRRLTDEKARVEPLSKDSTTHHGRKARVTSEQMMRKQGNTARGSNTSNSPSSPLTESYVTPPPPPPPGNGWSRMSFFEARPAMTRHTSIALLPLPPPALSWARPLPSNVQIAAPSAAAGGPDPPRPAAVPRGPLARRGAHAAEPHHLVPVRGAPRVLVPGPPDPARFFTSSRYSSNRAAVRCPFCTLRITSTRPANGFGPQLVWKMISTTLRDGWPSGSSVSAGHAGSAAAPVRARGVAPGSASSAFAAVLCGSLRTGAGAGGGGAGPGLLGSLLLGDVDDVPDGLGALSATGRVERRRRRRRSSSSSRRGGRRGRGRGGREQAFLVLAVMDVVERPGLAVQRLHPTPRH
ncbi:hypothetical protein NL676_010298 [Syzygium grande]|nr:hypothetical protein NL676_010298 [Syzygium grande]